MSSPPLRKRLSPIEGPRPPRRPAPGPPDPPASAWTEAKVKTVLDAFRSFVSNSAKKHGVSPEEVVSLVKDHLLDPEG